MNRIYRSIWNATLGAWVAAPETARGTGGTSSQEAGGTLPPIGARVLRRSRLAIAVAAVCGSVGMGSAAWAAGNVDTGSGLVFNGLTDEAVSDIYVGAGSITKNGTASLTLNGASAFTGGVVLNAGSLVVGDNQALGSGALTVGGSATLDSGSALVLGNNVILHGGLTVAGGKDLGLNGTLSGNGSLVKSGLSTLTLGGDNTFSGGVRLNAGTLNLASSTGLGSGALTAAGGIFNNTVAANLGNAVHLLGSLTLSGAQDLVLSGVIDGTGNLAKTGTGNLFLFCDNSYTGNTFLLGGTTTVGSNTAFGTGNVTTGFAGLDSNAAVNLANNFSLLGALTIGGTSDLTLSGTLNGAGGSLAKNGAGTLTLLGSNHYSAGTVLNAGTLAVGQNDSLGSGNLTVGGASTLAAANNGVALSNSIQTDSSLTIDGANNLTLNSVISGSGSLTKNGTSTLTLNGANTYNGGTTLNGGTVVVGNNSAFGTGAVVANPGNTATTVRNTQTRILNNTFVVDGNLSLETNNELQLVGALNGSGTLTKTGSDEVLLLSAGNFNGDIDVKAGYVTAIAPNALGDLRSASLAAGAGLTVDGNISIGSLSGQGVMRITNGQVSVGGNNLDSVFAGTVTANGGFNKIGAGVLELAGTSDHTGANTVSAGTLKVTGALSGSGGLSVDAGATLTGSGSINGTTTLADGATLAGYSGQTLTFNNLVLSQNSIVNFNLGSPVTGGTALFNVNSDLTMAGTFNIADFGGLGNGVYRLFDYGGSLTDNGVTFGTVPTGVDVSELTLLTGTQNQVNLLVSSPNLVIQFWDGVGTTSNGLVQGGSGVWDSTTNNWAEHDGFGNLDWQGNFAVFQGATGTVTVDGQQTVSGMQFMTDGYHLVAGTNGSLNINNRNGTYFAVRTDNGVTATLDVPLTGAGTLNKLDVGTLVLNGVNTYSGGTLLNGGTLVLGNDSALGTGSLTTAAGTTLDSNQAVTIGNAVTVNGALNLAGSNDLTLNGVVSGSGGLVKNGNGYLTLGGVNTFTGGVQLNAGRLILDTNGSPGTGVLTAANGTSLDTRRALTVANTINLAGNLTVIGSYDLTLNGQINGAGSLTKQGSNTLALYGANSFSGGVNLQGGILDLGHAWSLGSGALTVSGASVLDTKSAFALDNAIQLNAALTLTGSNDLTLNGVVNGTGSLTKNGLGTLVLSGANSYSGGTTIHAGRLVAASSQALGLGNVTVNAGAGLDVARGVGLSVGGDLLLQSGSSFRTYIGCNCSSTNVAGVATVAGSALYVSNTLDSSVDFQVGQTYTILHAAGGLWGQFATTTSNYAYLDAALTYTTNDVLLQLKRKTTSGGNTGGGNTGGGTIRFADLAETGNQRQAAQGIESLPSTHALYKYVETLPAGTPAAAFNSLSGDTHATVGGSLVGLGAFAPGLSSKHLLGNLTAGMHAGAPVAQSDGALPASAWPSSKALPAWAEVVGHWQRYDGDGNAAQLKQRTTGLFLGMDQEVGTSGWRLGGSLGYTNASGKVADRSSESDVNSYSAAVYGGKSFGTGTGPRINVLGGLAYTWHDIETTRRVSSLGQTLKADYSAHTAQLFAEVGYAIGQYDKVGFEPFAGVSLGQQRTGSFQEHGGFAALQGRSSTDDLASTTLGVRVHSDFQLAGKEGRLRATVGWRHAFGDVTAKKTMAFEGSQNFTVAGTPLARNTAVLGLESDVALSRTAALVLGYQGEMGSGQRDHSASVKLRWAF